VDFEALVAYLMAPREGAPNASVSVVLVVVSGSITWKDSEKDTAESGTTSAATTWGRRVEFSTLLDELARVAARTRGGAFRNARSLPRLSTGVDGGGACVERAQVAGSGGVGERGGAVLHVLARL
jgi:hypothetical protein